MVMDVTKIARWRKIGGAMKTNIYSAFAMMQGPSLQF